MYVRALLVSFLFCLFGSFNTFAALVASPSDASEGGPGFLDEDQYEDFGIGVPMEIYALYDAPAPIAITESDLVNCVRYDVTISGTQYVFLLPSAYESSLMVDSDGYLWNVSGSAITGRLFSGSFSPTADTGLLLTLGPCLGNNFQLNHDYGSPNYIRSYYWSSTDRLSYSTTYVTVSVRDTFHLYNSGEFLSYVIVFLLGCCLICLWKKGV